MILIRPAATLLLGISISASELAEPRNAQTLDALDARKVEQFRTARQFKSFHDFQFANQIEQSGITFQHQIVDDCSREVKAIIYDHGTGVAVADVDSDGKTDIFFVNQLGGCELWRNVGSNKFANITSSAGVALADKICVAASFGDLDNDGDPDLFVTTVKMGNVLFENLGGGKFRDISASAGVDFVGHSSGTLFFDFDNDGLLDLFVANVGIYTTEKRGRGGYYVGVNDVAMGFTKPERQELSLLYKNLGGLKFKEVSKEMNLRHAFPSGDAAFGDVNEDGFQDLYVLNMSGPNKFYLNQKGKGFAEMTGQVFGKTPSGAMGIKFFDYNQDGNMDLFVTDMHSDMSAPQTKEGKQNFRLNFEKAKSDFWCGLDWSADAWQAATNQMIFGNAFHQNAGQGRFTEVSDRIGVETYWPWGVTVADFNADGFEDMFVTSGMGYPFRYSINNLLLNEGGRRFYDAEFLVNMEPRLGSQVDKDYFTLDCSGEDKTNSLCYHKKGEIAIRGALSSRSSAAADLDDDGDLDLVVADFNDRPQIQINNLTSKKKINYLKVKLTGTRSNRDALGATVRVRTSGKTLTQYNDGKSGYLSQSSQPLYFGVGEAAKIHAIQVIWPSGKKQMVTTGLHLNELIEIKETAADLVSLNTK